MIVIYGGAYYEKQFIFIDFFQRKLVSNVGGFVFAMLLNICIMFRISLHTFYVNVSSLLYGQ